jgi:hypothetical protein
MIWKFPVSGRSREHAEAAVAGHARWRRQSDEAIDERSGRRLPRLPILNDASRPLAGSDIGLAPGPGGERSETHLL